jgi:hypothetical protein
MNGLLVTGATGKLGDAMDRLLNEPGVPCRLAGRSESCGGSRRTAHFASSAPVAKSPRVKPKWNFNVIVES